MGIEPFTGARINIEDMGRGGIISITKSTQLFIFRKDTDSSLTGGGPLSLNQVTNLLAQQVLQLVLFCADLL